nr:hypothetical protein [Kibdelosporangium sp. MJ126-NF4]CEL23504.1 hypothetical protein [Kibdelosporangium sp. MJ126-NF4]CTQ89118.1 hypothetical protein [Kibdelosporangium sp. MJ126-NF4]
MASISVTIHDQDPATAEKLARQLRAELLALDVDDARFDAGSHEHVPGSKGMDPETVTTIIVTLSGSPVLIQLARALRDFVNRDRDREVTIKRGKDSITIKGSPGERTEKVIEQFLEAIED